MRSKAVFVIFPRIKLPFTLRIFCWRFVCWTTTPCTKMRFIRRASVVSVPAKLGKGQGAKEIGHNLARERPKFGHNLVRKRHKIGHSLEREWPSEAHFYAWTTKIRSQSSVRMKRGLGTIVWAIDENMGTNLLAVTSIFTSAVWKHKNSNYIL